ncbi:GCN5-related N-acetyltransferase [Pontivivens insulae]|nr:GCN5-related N-acetyltransferase [Pontivivens insulae]
MSDREMLEQRWLQLTREVLPEVARARGWPVHLDHCFQRVLLDHACGGVWYDTIAQRPAYAHAPEAILRAAVETGEAALRGEADLPAMNRASLSWRGKG